MSGFTDCAPLTKPPAMRFQLVSSAEITIPSVPVLLVSAASTPAR